jgi:hypothetical protein
MLLKSISLFIGLMFCWQNVFAQSDSATATKQEVWPELDVYYKFNKKVRLLALYSTTRLRSSGFNDGTLGIYVDYFAVPWLGKIVGLKPLYDSTPGVFLWLRLGYGYSTTRAGVENPSTEQKIVTEGTFRINLPYHILLSQRNHFDWEMATSGFIGHYRSRLRFEKHMRTEYLTFIGYLYGEYFTDLHKKTPDMFRFGWGLEFKITRTVNFEAYHVHQFDITEGTKALDAVGLNLKFYLSHAVMKKKFSRVKYLEE